LRMAPKRARSEQAGTEAHARVTLLVGPDEVEVEAASACLATAFGFFDAALKGDWHEAQARQIKLPDNEPHDIRLLVQLVSFEVFVEDSNVVQFLPLFRQFSATPSLFEHAEAKLLHHLEVKQNWHELGFAEVASGSEAENDIICELLRLAVDIESEPLREMLVGIVDERRIASLRVLAIDSRYADVMRLLWPRVREGLLSQAQRDAGDMQEPPTPETAEYLWPVLEHAMHQRLVLTQVRHHMEGALPTSFRKVTPQNNAMGQVFTAAATSTQFFEQHIRRLVPGIDNYSHPTIVPFP